MVLEEFNKCQEQRKKLAEVAKAIEEHNAKLEVDNKAPKVC